MLSGVAPALPPGLAERVIVGHATGDDAGVYRVRDDLGLVVTTDLITPVLDDPGLFGEIAAANALSDVFAMGGEPLVALNVSILPAAVTTQVAREIFAGAERKVREAGAVILGGHTVRGPELLFGLAVTGSVHPDRVLTNAGARPGDRLLLTRRLGTGVIINGWRQGKVPEAVLRRACADMAVLNRDASRVALAHGTRAATDVTGFGLGGHLLGMARASQVGFRVEVAKLPRYPESLEAIRAGVTTGATRPNRLALEPHAELAPSLSPEERTLLCDPQTSGGLLLALPAERADAALAALHAAGLTHAALIGEAVPGPPVLRFT